MVNGQERIDGNCLEELSHESIFGIYSRLRTWRELCAATHQGYLSEETQVTQDAASRAAEKVCGKIIPNNISPADIMDAERIIRAEYAELVRTARLVAQGNPMNANALGLTEALKAVEGV